MKLFKSFSEKIAIKKAYKDNADRDLSKRNEPIKTIGFLVDDSFGEINNKIISALVDHNLNAEDIKIFTFATSEIITTKTIHNILNERDFGFGGKILNVDAISFLDLKLDCLVCVNYKNSNRINVMAARSKAQFKVGFCDDNLSFFDLVFQPQFKTIYALLEELMRYFKILNKL